MSSVRARPDELSATSRGSPSSDAAIGLPALENRPVIAPAQTTIAATTKRRVTITPPKFLTALDFDSGSRPGKTGAYGREPGKKQFTWTAKTRSEETDWTLNHCEVDPLSNNESEFRLPRHINGVVGLREHVVGGAVVMQL